MPRSAPQANNVANDRDSVAQDASLTTHDSTAKEIERPSAPAPTPSRSITIKLNVGNKKNQDDTLSTDVESEQQVDGQSDFEDVTDAVEQKTEAEIPVEDPVEVDPPTSRRPRRAAAVQAKKKLKADDDGEDADDEYRSSRPAVRKSMRVTRSSAR